MTTRNFGPRHVVAVLFGVLGTGTLSLNLIAVVIRKIDSADAVILLLSVLYGFSAIFTGYGLWKQTRLGEFAFLAWCSTIVAFMVDLVSSDPSLLDPWLIPGFVATIAMLYFGWRRIRRICSLTGPGDS